VAGFQGCAGGVRGVGQGVWWVSGMLSAMLHPPLWVIARGLCQRLRRVYRDTVAGRASGVAHRLAVSVGAWRERMFGTGEEVSFVGVGY
jgi:hypothetical protein